MNSKKSECSCKTISSQSIDLTHLELDPSLRYGRDSRSNLVEFEENNKSMKSSWSRISVANFKLDQTCNGFCLSPCVRIHPFKEDGVGSKDSSVSQQFEMFVKSLILNTRTSHSNIFKPESYQQNDQTPKQDKKRLMSTLNKFKSSVDQPEYRNRLENVKKKLKESSDRLVGELTESRDRLLSQLDQFEAHCSKTFETNDLDNWKSILNSFQSTMNSDNHPGDDQLDELLVQIENKHKELNEHLSKLARIRLEPREIDSEAAFLISTELINN